MKICTVIILFAALSLLPPLSSPAQEATDPETAATETSDAQIQERVQRVAEEIQRRRQIRQAIARSTGEMPELPKPAVARNPNRHGAVHSPPAVVGPDEPISSLVVVDYPLGGAAEIYALLVQKEVMLSAKVATIRITVRVEGMNRTEACAAFEDALTQAGVTIQPLDDDTVALLATKTVNNADSSDDAVTTP